MINKLTDLIHNGKPELNREYIVECIIYLNTELNNFWRKCKGWAPDETAELLSEARLDRQVSMSHVLKLTLIPIVDKSETEGRLILAYVNLRSLMESTLRLYLTVWQHDYYSCSDSPRNKKGAIKQISHKISLEEIKLYMEKKKLFDTLPSQHAHGFPPIRTFFNWVERVQHRGNVIHSFKHKELGTFDEFYEDTARYFEFLEFIIDNIPYPDDEIYKPRAFYKPFIQAKNNSSLN